MYIRTPHFKHLRAVLALSVIVLVFIYTILVHSQYKNEVELLKKSVHSKDQFIDELSASIDIKYPALKNYERKDWHDYEFMKYEAARKGPGEQGSPYTLTETNDIQLNEKLFQIEGLFVVVSDKISVNRSVPDVRIEQCKSKKYLKTLPSTSVIVIFHNEYWSILLRTVHAIVNRTPKELLHEIILVNDKSTKEELYKPLQQYMDEHFNGIVKILNLPERMGLIVTRMEGAKIATGEILVFFDSHIEVNVNWLPPLIEPIAINPKVGTCPIVDNFSHDTFQYQKFGDGSRGVFDWNFIYHWLPRRPQDMIVPDKPFSLPIMLGCAFAINRQNYWDLGAYDDQLMIWNGENYELSFKLHLCGGELLEVPCSRVAHTFRKHNEYRKKTGVDFVARNFKRIAEVWLDDYKKILYNSEPERYAKIDEGDLTKAKAIHRNLNCKPFQYYLDYIAPDMLERYPSGDVGVFAKGTIISEAKGTGDDANKKLCIDTLARPTGKPLGLYNCHSDFAKPSGTQDFILTWHRNIKINNIYDNCLDTFETALFGCHYSFGHQYFKYDIDTHQIINPTGVNSFCLTANFESKNLSMIKCDTNNMFQKWDWGYKNVTALQNWDTFGVKIPS